MCHDPKARPPLPPIAGGAGRASTRHLILDASDGNRFRAFSATTATPGGPGILILPDVRGLHPFYVDLAVRFGLPPSLPPEMTRMIKSADRAAAYLEATRLAGFKLAEAQRFFGTPPDVPASFERDYLVPWSAKDAEARYLRRFAELAESA